MAHTRALIHKLTSALAVIGGASLLLGCATDRIFGLGPRQTPQVEAAEKLHQCASCHGGNGVSSAALFPNLAGQQQAYLVTQLTAFRQHTRKDRDGRNFMWGMASGLSDGAIKILATDYSAKAPTPPSKHVKGDVDAGKAIFENGVASHGVLACVSCHGAKAEGNTIIPRLAGQHQDYLDIQLRAFASGSRDNAAMHLIAKAMTPQERKAVTDYVASL